MPNLKPDITTINKNFIIRYSYIGLKGSKLIGAGQYHRLVKCEKRKINHFKRALSSGITVTTFSVNNVLKIDFIHR